jgi:hypothetical protein
MPALLVSAGRTVAAPAAVAGERMADHRTGHPSILPAAHVGRLEVPAGGCGAGTAFGVA